MDATYAPQPLTHEHYAGFRVRVFAVVIDMILCKPIYDGLHFALDEVHPLLADVIFTVFALLTYSWFFASHWQASPGMRLLEIRITDRFGDRISFARAMIWCITSMVSWMICLAGVLYLQIHFDLQAIFDLTFSCVKEKLTREDCASEIEPMLGVSYDNFQSMTLAASGMGAFLLFIWALSIALSRDKSGFHNLLCGTRFVRGRA